MGGILEVDSSSYLFDCTPYLRVHVDHNKGRHMFYAACWAQTSDHSPRRKVPPYEEDNHSVRAKSRPRNLGDVVLEGRVTAFHA